MLNTDGKILRQEQAAQVGGEACQSSRPDFMAFLRCKTDAGCDIYHGSQTDGAEQDPDSVVEKLLHLMQTLFEESEDDIPEGQVQKGIRKGAEDFERKRTAGLHPQLSEHVHDEEILADSQRIQNGYRSQLLPEGSVKGQQHHGGKPDKIQHYIKNVIGKDDHTGDRGAGNFP